MSPKKKAHPVRRHPAVDRHRHHAAPPGRPGARRGLRPVVAPATARDWIGAARLRTLPLAVAPVALGTGAAYVAAGYHLGLTLLCLAVALFLQIGVNFANDYSDGIRGTDAHRVGAARLTGSGKARPRTVLFVAGAFFALAITAGLAAVILSGRYVLLAVGAAALAAAWFYTGGKRPYGYAGFGELAVVIFFGVVPAAGTTYLQVGVVNLESWLSGLAAGSIAAAAILVNNLRDIEQDRRAGKRTLSVRVGSRASRVFYCILVAAPFGVLAFFAVFYPLAILVFFALLIAIPAALIVSTARSSRELILALSLTGLLGLTYGLGLGLAFAF